LVEVDPAWKKAIKDLSDAIFEMAEQGMNRKDVKEMVDQEFDKIERNARARLDSTTRVGKAMIDATRAQRTE